jgi:hypothetical protein
VETDSVDDLLQQLSNFPREKKTSEGDVELSKENIEDFLLKYTGRLVKDSVESILKNNVFID